MTAQLDESCAVVVFGRFRMILIKNHGPNKGVCDDCGQ